jgi:photosystem II stability/assembly factor-like uncharacterized protein
MKSNYRLPPFGAATGIAVAILMIAALGQASTQDPPKATSDPATQVAETKPRAVQSLLLDLAQASSRGVAVGERGHVLVSESRREWRQVENVPTRSTLTAVTTVGDKVWAVGHDGVIIHSADGGLTWERQRAAPYDPESTDLHNGVPLLDVLFFDDNNGLAVGAYALLLRTADGGRTWTQQSLSATAPDAAAEGAAAASMDDSAMDDAAEDEASWTFDEDELELEEESDPHLNGIVRTGDGSLMIVAERGSAFRSTDGGYQWQRLKLPYDGSMFGVIGFEGRHVLAFGLRGNVFESTDLGDSWRKIDTGVDLSLMGGTGWDGGGVALVGANGVVLTRSGMGSPLLAHTHPEGVVLSSVFALAPNGELVVAGENGVSTYTPN